MPRRKDVHDKKTVEECCCGVNTGEQMVFCNGNSCYNNNWQHYSCAELTLHQLANIDIIEFTCKSCLAQNELFQKETPMEIDNEESNELPLEQPINESNELPLEPPMNESNSLPLESSELEVGQETLDEQYFTPESILEHGIDFDPKTEKAVGMKFLIKWKDFSNEEATWEYEGDLVTQYDLVSNYRTKHNLGPTILKPIGGAASNITGDHNINNWVKPEDVIRIISQYSNLDSYSTKNLKITPLVLNNKRIKLKQDTIYVLLMRNHYYIVTEYNSKWFIADSLNECIWNRSELEDLLNIQLKTLNIERTRGMDHCGGMAAMIALQIIRSSTTKLWTVNIHLIYLC